jgi:prepilin-type N-terminal cleavage/methylation domain-containing protein
MSTRPSKLPAGRDSRTLRQSAGRREAFTLLEIMLAVTILAIVVTAVYSTWSAALTAWKRGTDVTDTFQRQRIVLDTLSELTKSAVFYGAKPELYAIKGTHSDVKGDTISFVTGSDVLLPPAEGFVAGMRRVSISLAQDRDGNVFLGISNAPALQDTETEKPPEVHVLSADVTGFGVRYLDPRSSAWVDAWEEQTVTPAALSFTVTFRGGDAGTPAVSVMREMELPAAQFALERGGSTVELPPGMTPAPPPAGGGEK